MLKTLWWYISRELLRVTLLALVCFTLLFTVIAIMEPMRKNGLATGQVASLFVYMIPVMISMTLPFSALFATCIVYGRFAQDREMLACRASGISNLNVMKPALGLGILVTVISLILTNLVAPIMLKAGTDEAFKNIRRIVYHAISKEGQFELGNGRRLHATDVDEKNNVLYGVVLSQLKSQYNPETGRNDSYYVQWAMARAAELEIQQDPDSGKFYGAVRPHDAVGPFTNTVGSRVDMGVGSVIGFELPSLAEENAKFYDWPKLIAVYRDPTKHQEVREGMERLTREIRLNRAVVAAAEALRSGQYTGLRQGTRQFVVSAPRVLVDKDTALLRSRLGASRPHRVQVRVLEGARETTITADEGRITANWDVELSQLDPDRGPHMSITLTGDVEILDPTVTGEQHRPERWMSGAITMPDDPQMPLFLETAYAERDAASETPEQRAERLQRRDELIAAVYQHPEQYTSSKVILAKVASLRDRREPKVRGKILAEMNLRIAFGLSSMLLVAMGGALGVRFRSGNVLTAFAVSVVTGAALVVLILMGKQTIANPDSAHGTLIGMTAIWGGLLAMLTADVVVYLRLCRQ